MAKRLIIITIICYLTYCAPVPPKLQTGQGKIISDDLRLYLSNIYTALENSTEFLNHISSLQHNETEVDISLLSTNVLNKLHEIKMDTKNKFIELHRLYSQTGKDLTVTVPRDLAEVVNAGQPTSFSSSDFQQILKTVRERQEAIDREEIILLKELEVAEILQRWESHLNQSAEDKAKAKKDFEEEKRHHPKPGALHEPASKEQEREEWAKADDLSEDSFNPRLFFLRHDVNSDGFWDREEVEGMLSVQIGKWHEGSPIKRQEYLNDMMKNVFDNLDKDGDGLISLQEHMDHMASEEALNDDGWNPEEDELDTMGALATEDDLQKIAAKIKEFESVDPDSVLVKDLRARYERLEHDFEPK